MDKQQRIIDVVKLIPSGNVASYGQIADLAGLPGRARLVGTALKNHGGAELPWYRVLKSNGCLAFERNSQQALTQQQLLEREGVLVLKNRVNMKQFGWQPTAAELVLHLQY